MFLIKRMPYSAILLFILTCSLCSADLPETASLLPEDIVFLVEINDIDQLINNINKTSMGKLYHDPAMSKFIEKIKTGIKEMADEDQELKFFLDNAVLPKGRVAVAISAANDKVLILTQWKDNIDKFKQAVNQAQQELAGDNKDFKKETFRGVEITTVISEYVKGIKPGSDADTVQPETVTSEDYYCFVDDIFLYSRSLDTLQFTIAHIQGASGEVLSDKENYQSFKKALVSNSDISIFMDVKALINTFVDPQMKSNPEQKKIYDSLGLDGFDYLAATVSVADTSQVDFLTRAMMGTSSPRRGLLKMFELENARFKPPAFLTDKYSSVSYFNWNINAAFDELFRMLSGIQPMFAAMLNSPLTPPGPDGSGGIILKRDVISHFGSQIISAEVIDNDSKEAFNSFPLIAIAVNNKNALESSLSKLHNMFLANGKPELKREFLGHNIYSLNLPSFIMGDNSDMISDDEKAMTEMLKISFSITDSHLIIGSDSSVEQALRSLADKDTASIASSAWYQKAIATIPTSSCMGSISDSKSYSRQFWNFIKEDSFSDLMAQGVGKFYTKSVTEIVDFSLLPDFEQVSKYFGISTYYGIMKKDGLYIEAKSLKN